MREDKGMKDFDGVVWFRKTIDIPRNWARKNVTINMIIPLPKLFGQFGRRWPER